jgi:hypothetical protein
MTNVSELLYRNIVPQALAELLKMLCKLLITKQLFLFAKNYKIFSWMSFSVVAVCSAGAVTSWTMSFRAVYLMANKRR